MVKGLEGVLAAPILAGMVPMVVGAYNLSEISPEDRTISYAGTVLLCSVGAFAITLASRGIYRKVKEKYF